MRRAPLLARLCCTAAPCFLVGCATTAHQELAPMAEAQVVTDYDTYALRRVGLVPLAGEGLDADYADVVQSALAAELSAGAPFEAVALGANDLEGVPGSEPHRRGRYPAGTILETARRYHLDAILVATAADVQLYRPLSLTLRADLIAAETGAVIWSASVTADAATERTVRGLEAFYSRDETERWDLSLISPRRFARFAAHELARVL